MPLNDDTDDQSKEQTAAGCPHPGHDPNENEPLSRDEAYSIAIDFGMVFGIRLEPKRHGLGFSALVPMEFLKRYLPAPQEPEHRSLRGH
jgi:hypothetical protein